MAAASSSNHAPPPPTADATPSTPRILLERFSEKIRTTFADPEELRRRHASMVPVAKAVMGRYPLLGPLGPRNSIKKRGPNARDVDGFFFQLDFLNFAASVWHVSRTLVFFRFLLAECELGAYILGSIRLKLLTNFLAAGANAERIVAGDENTVLRKLAEAVYPLGSPTRGGNGFCFWHPDEFVGVSGRLPLCEGHVLAALLGCGRDFWPSDDYPVLDFQGGDFRVRMHRQIRGNPQWGSGSKKRGMDIMTAEIQERQMHLPLHVNVACMCAERIAAAGCGGGARGVMGAGAGGFWMETGIITEEQQREWRAAELQEQLVEGEGGRWMKKVRNFSDPPLSASVRQGAHSLLPLSANEEGLRVWYQRRQKSLGTFYIPGEIRRRIYKFLPHIIEGIYRRYEAPLAVHTPAIVPPSTVEAVANWGALPHAEWVRAEPHRYFFAEDIRKRVMTSNLSAEDIENIEDFQNTFLDRVFQRPSLDWKQAKELAAYQSGVNTDVLESARAYFKGRT